ncbi:unnamed protein product [Paramecium octaurelia]|uniref:Myb-like domain-containing protein n=1 Tax=Paramecium octaurelia TaxID=43137 RepID=A0A8S1T5W0_PAROT|nr:unnamed protein product [Paramecium octaurelia]
MNQQNSDAELRFINSVASSPHTHKLAKQIYPLDYTYSQQEYESTPIVLRLINQPSNDLIVLTKKKIRKQLPSNQLCNSGHWTPEEHQTYVEFLQNHLTQSLSCSQDNKKNNKIFKLMSQTIGTRSPSQCRSHHQKFNPNTPAGQKRMKKTNKKINANFQIKLPITNSIKQFYTPDLKPNLGLHYDLFQSLCLTFQNVMIHKISNRRNLSKLEFESIHIAILMIIKIFVILITISFWNELYNQKFKILNVNYTQRFFLVFSVKIINNDLLALLQQDNKRINLVILLCPFKLQFQIRNIPQFISIYVRV